MNIEYITFNKDIEVYFGILNKEVKLVEEVNALEWIDINDNFFDMNKYAGEGNIGHIIEEIKISLNSNETLEKNTVVKKILTTKKKEKTMDNNNILMSQEVMANLHLWYNKTKYKLPFK